MPDQPTSPDQEAQRDGYLHTLLINPPLPRGKHTFA